MFGLGGQELIIILAIVFFLFGAKKLPEFGAGIGKALRNFKSGMKVVEEGMPGNQPDKTREEGKRLNETTSV
jgi:sec-independent protein translocase protein TatA